MPRILIAVVNCHSRLAYQQAIRDTWLPLVQGADVKFFLGPSERSPKEDEVFLDCDDSYTGLPSKVRAIMRWSKEHEYDFVLKCDDDVVLIPDKILSSGFERYDFTGHRNDVRPFPVPYGFCYWLSKKTVSLVADADLPLDGNDEAWVTGILAKSGIVLHHDSRYAMHLGERKDFVPSVPRPLRAPPRPSPWIDPMHEVFAYCMYIHWSPGGYRGLPEHENIAEMKRVFKKARQHVIA